LVSRTPTEAGAIAGLLRDAVWAVDSNQPIDQVTSVEQALYDANASTYALLTLFVVFALLALVMAAIGVYGVMSYSVSQRKAEIGLRMALGAEASEVRMMVVKQGVRIVLFGVGIGLVMAFLLGQALSTILYAVNPTDPLSFVGMPLILSAVALLANLIPAVRATRTDPVTALRAE